jgi:molybdopterin synthase catalytic subunit
VELIAIGPEPLSIEALVSAVETRARQSGDGCGAVATFVGVVRATHQGRKVRYLTYEAFDELAMNVFARIGDEIHASWPGAVVAIHHRTGRLMIGEASVAIAGAAAHRAEAFQVCRYAIERVKQIAPVWKHEVFEDGEAWVEGAVADPDDEASRLEARARACA